MSNNPTKYFFSFIKVIFLFQDISPYPVIVKDEGDFSVYIEHHRVYTSKKFSNIYEYWYFSYFAFGIKFPKDFINFGNFLSHFVYDLEKSEKFSRYESWAKN